MTDQEKRELLVRLAENVIGAKLISQYEGFRFSRYTFETKDENYFDVKVGSFIGDGWNPLESIADAWMLVEALMCSPHDTTTEFQCDPSVIDHYRCSMMRCTDHGTTYMADVSERSMPLAICLAADAATREASA